MVCFCLELTQTPRCSNYSEQITLSVQYRMTYDSRCTVTNWLMQLFKEGIENGRQKYCLWGGKVNHFTVFLAAILSMVQESVTKHRGHQSDATPDSPPSEGE